MGLKLRYLYGIVLKNGELVLFKQKTTVMRKLNLTILIAMVLLIAGCKKDTLQTDQTNDIDMISSYVQNKILNEEFTQIDWIHFKVQKLNNDKTVYSFNFKNKKLKQISAIKKDHSYLVQITEYDIKSGIIKIKLRDLNNGAEIIKEKEINASQNFQIINFNSTVGDLITLPPVVVYSYHHNHNGNFTTIIFNQIYQNNNSTNPNPYGTGLYETIGEGATTNTDGQGPEIEGYLEFESIEEAVEFFQWMNTINPAEAALVAQYPSQGLLVFRNSKTALTASQNWAANHPGPSNSPNDGRADAIRHAFWQALNTSDIGPVLATAFAIAHETSPSPPGISASVFLLMTQMDTHNNNFGISLSVNQGWGFLTSNSTI
jgi:hypothetical protein